MGVGVVLETLPNLFLPASGSAATLSAYRRVTFSVVLALALGLVCTFLTRERHRGAAKPA